MLSPGLAAGAVAKTTPVRTMGRGTSVLTIPHVGLGSAELSSRTRRRASATGSCGAGVRWRVKESAAQLRPRRAGLGNPVPPADCALMLLLEHLLVMANEPLRLLRSRPT